MYAVSEWHVLFVVVFSSITWVVTEYGGLLRDVVETFSYSGREV